MTTKPLQSRAIACSLGQAAACCGILLLSACAMDTEIHGPNGETAHLIECPGLALSMGTCYSKANALCPAGYTVLDAQQSQGAAIASSNGAGSWGQFGGNANAYGFAAPTVQRQLVVQCAK